MCIGGLGKQPKMPAPPPPPEPPEPAPTKQDPAVAQARTDTRNRVRAMAGRKSTIKTSSRGLMNDDANTQKKTLGGY